MCVGGGDYFFTLNSMANEPSQNHPLFRAIKYLSVRFSHTKRTDIKLPDLVLWTEFPNLLRILSILRLQNPSSDANISKLHIHNGDAVMPNSTSVREQTKRECSR